MMLPQTMFSRIISSPLGGIRGGLLLLLCLCSLFAQAAKKVEPTVVAYVTSWTRVIPDPTVMTHLNYAFGHVNNDFNGVRIDNPERLRQMVALKKGCPSLHVMLSVGGWGSGRFSEMAASEENRRRFAADCRRVCDEFGLDGIDIDWEYPTQKSAGISCSPDDTENFTLLMRDLRQALGDKLWLTIATVCSAQYIDFRACIQYLDMVNVMSYDMGNPPKHHATLHRSPLSGWYSADEAIQAHIKAGVPREKLNMGMPFYGRGKVGGYLKNRDELRSKYTEKWDDVAMVPYLQDGSGEMVLGYDNVRSLAAKCRYAKEQGLRGTMYWEYGDDTEQGDERRTLWRNIMQSDKERIKACRTAARQLAAAMQEDCKREDITPDSFYHDMRRLKAEMLAEKDPTAQAIRRALLAHKLCQNTWRSQARSRQTVSHPDSIQEWSREEYIGHAADLYADALSDMDALHGISLKDVKPLVRGGKDDAIFQNDILYLIWQNAVQDIDTETRSKHLVPDYRDIIDVYRRHGLREATLQLRLDSLNQQYNLKEDKLLSLRDEYADLSCCALVYLRLADVPGKTPHEQYDILTEGLQRYPKSREAGELKNRMAMLRSPRFSAEFHGMYHPDHDYEVPIKVKNMSTASIAVYRLPDDFEYSNDEKAGTQMEQVRRSGTLVETLTPGISSSDPLEEQRDTLIWHTPTFGRYALVLDGTSPEKLADDYQPTINMTSVSALYISSTTMPNGKIRLMVTDALSGEPQSGVTATLFRSQNDDDNEQVCQLMTDNRGIAETDTINGDRLYVKIERGEDKAYERQFVSNYWPSGRDDKRESLALYTDRSIYRPGQTVYIGGIAHTETHEAKTAKADEEITLRYLDANGQEVAKHTLRTDAFGTVSDSILLPKSCLPGNFRIVANNRHHYFRVEEYRRPTFEVKMDKPEAVSLPADSMTFTGSAVTYSQWPVGNARVTGKYHLEDNWWLRRVGRQESHRIDTLYTDAEGRFSVRVPIDASREQLKIGQTLTLNVDVLSPEGETQSATIRVPLCTEPLRLAGDISKQQNRESLRPWHFDLISSNNQPIDGDIACILLQGGKEVSRFPVKANRDTIPQTLLTLPSGRYDLVASAEVKGDTASYKASFTIFSITDKKLTDEQDLWLATPCDTISPDRPARIQIGTTLPEAWIYCYIAGEEGAVVSDTILHLSDEALLMEIPYETRFKHHLSVNLMLVHDGRLSTRKSDFLYVGPDTRLTMRWDTFRNLLEPGQKEHWRLTLTRPDGTPAAANVMVSMYDAALDALAPYKMSHNIGLCTRHAILATIDNNRFNRSRFYTELNLPLRFLPYEDYDFARWNESLFMGGHLAMMNVRKNSRAYKAGGASMIYDMVEPPRVMREVAASVKASGFYNGTNAALEGSIAGLDTAEESAETVSDDEVSIREDLSELAFFYPQLRTDSKGQTSIDFTLPDGLTSWHLHGLAHTQDMMTAQWEETIVAKKQLMAELTLPRFLRNGDEAMLTASIRNASDTRQKGEATLDVYCAEDYMGVKRMTVKFDLLPGAEAVYHLPIRATLDHPVLAVEWVAKARQTSDGEVRYLPVLSDMQNVTETRSYTLRGDTILKMDLTDLFAKGNPKATGKALTVEHVTSPTILALQTLPSLTAPVRSDVLSIAAAYYGGSVARYIADKSPDIREAIEAWAKQEDSNALESPLVRNQQLAGILLNETPWMVEAHQQKASYQRIVDLLDDMQQEQRRMTLLSALSARQNSDGSFGWYPGMTGNQWVTSEVVRLLMRLKRITGDVFEPERQVVNRALGYLNRQAHEHVQMLRKEKAPQLTLSDLHYLYIYIMFNSKGESDDSKFLMSLLRKQAEGLDREERALAAIVLQKVGEEKQAQRLMPRLHELLRHADGAYLAYPSGSFTSIDRKIETHVNLMEAIRRVEPDETELLCDMTAWLIQQKRTQEWERPVQSADAVYALLRASGYKAGNGLWRSRISYGNNQPKKIETPKPFYGYVRERIDPIAKPHELYVEQKQKEGNVSWGAVYAQYQLPAEEVEQQREGMTIRRDIDGEGQLREGDRVHIRYTITADRDYEYVSLRAPRPSASEPAQQLSGYRFQSGLSYYQAMHDASTEYFFDRLPRGTYVIEEDWIMTRSGSCLLPSAQLTCLYAPEYRSRTSGCHINVK